MEVLNSILEILKEGSVRKQFSYFFIIILILLFVDMSTDFFTNLFNQQKLDQIEKIETILANKKVDSTTKAYLKRMEKQIISRSDYRELASSSMEFFTGKVTFHERSTNFLPWHYLSSGGLFILIGLIFAYVLFTYRTLDNESVLYGVILIILCIIFSYIFSIFLTLIPVFEYRIINILLNLVCQTAAIYIFYLIFKSNSKNNDKETKKILFNQ